MLNFGKILKKPDFNKYLLYKDVRFMRLVLFFCFLLINILLSGQKVIKIDPDKGADRQLHLSEIASEIKYVKLETNDSCFISDVVKVVTDGAYIFISSHFKDYTRLLMFSESGKFKRNIGICGRGPGEYSDVMDFSINPSEQIIYILDPLGKILLYNYTGRYLITIKLDARPSNILFHNNKIWLFSAWPDYYLNNGYCIQVIEANNHGKKTYLLNRKRIKITRNPNSYIYPNFHYSVNSGNSISFFEERFDTLYYIDNQFKITPKFVIELKDDLPMNLSTADEFRQAFKTSNNLFDFIEIKNYLLFSVMSPNPVRKYFFAVSKASGEIFKHDMTKDKQQMINDLDIGLPFNLRGYASFNLLYSSIDCFKLKEYLEKVQLKKQPGLNSGQYYHLSKLVNDTKISDNPVLIFIKLK